MATRTERLALEVVSDVDSAADGLDRVAAAAADAAREVDNLTDATADTASKLDGVSGAADGLDGSMGAATGAMGALGSGLELLGAEGAAEALGKAALATDFLSGVGQSAALAVQAQGAATKALTVAQTAANAVMRANPIGLVVTAVLLLVGGLILAYEKSDRFREIVDKAGAVAKTAFGAVSDAIGDVVDWVRDKIPPAFEVFKKIIDLYLTPPKLALGLVVDVIQDIISFAGDIPDKFQAMKDKAESIGSALLAPFVKVRDAVQAILDKIASIKLPSIDLNPLNRSSAGGEDSSYDDEFAIRNGGGRGGGGGGVTNIYNIAVTQTIGDPVEAARIIRNILQRADRIVA